MTTASYSLNPFFHTMIIFKEGFICCMERSQHIYYVKYSIYVYTVNEWIVTVYLVMQLYEKSECQLWKLCTNFVM